MINAEAIDFAGSAANKVGLLGFTNSTDKIEIASLKRQLKEWAQYKTTTDARIINLQQHLKACENEKQTLQNSYDALMVLLNKSHADLEEKDLKLRELEAERNKKN